MPSLGILSTELTLNNKGLESGASKSQSTLRRLGGGLEDVTKKAALMGVGLGAAGVTMTATLTKQGLSAVDAQAKLARSLKGTNDAVRALQIAASDAGIQNMEKSLTRLNRRLGAAQMGQEEYAKSIRRLGLDIEELSEMDADDRVAAIADAVKDAGLSSEESARHLQQLGFEQSNANDFFRQGGDAIRAARQEVEEYGLSLSEVDSSQVEAANDAFSRVARVVEVIRQRLAVQLAPYIEFVANLINDAAKESGGFRDQIDNAITTGIRIGAKFADIVEGIRRAFMLAGQASAVAALAITQGFLEAGNAIMASPVKAVNTLIKGYNKVTSIIGMDPIDEFVQPDIVKNTQSTINMLKGAVEIGKAEMQATLMEPMPSSGLEEKLEAIRKKSREVAEQVVKDRENMDPPDTGNVDGGGGGGDDTDEDHKRQLEARLERIRESVMAEEELLEKKLAKDLERLKVFEEADILSDTEHKELKQELEEAHQERLTEIAARGEQDRTDAVGRFAKANVAIRENSMRAESSALRAGLQTMFGDAKQASKAMGALKKFEAITSAYSWGASIGGPYAGAAAAAVAAYAQQQNLDAISSQSFSGGTSNVSGVGDSSSFGGVEQDRSVSIDMSLIGGNDRDRAVAGSFIDQINEEIERGGRISRVGLA